MLVSLNSVFGVLNVHFLLWQAIAFGTTLASANNSKITVVGEFHLYVKVRFKL